jgi:predicted CXXCH cytochrome family protein
MKPATPATALADFASGVTQSDHTARYTFLHRGEALFAQLEERGAPRRELAVRFTFGLFPLQQYLLDAGDGRLQSLTLAWDSRAAERGGRRWFSLYPGERHGPGDPLHWSGYLQNWNLMCADCHATNLRKNYDPATHRYASEWSELAVGCEACHGPASEHLGWARSTRRTAAPQGSHGLAVRLDERAGIRWALDPSSGEPRRSEPRRSEREIEVCARCHARRGQLTDRVSAADGLHQGFAVSVLEPGLYYPDGQMREEAYNYGSFLQSRMYAAGVTCGDCHEPHSGATRFAGDALCTQCHEAGRYAASRHHLHAADSAGARCVSCHAPSRTYMIVDSRHDHSFRIPRPDRTLSMGVPNACNDCHRNRDARWAQQQIARRYPTRQEGFQRFAEAFADFDARRPGAAAAVLAVARDPSQSAIARASAIARLAAAGFKLESGVLLQWASDASPLVRRAAAAASQGEQQVLAALLADPVRSVRVEAAGVLADPGGPAAPPPEGSAAARVIAEYLEAQRFNADRPEAQANLGIVSSWRGDDAAAAAQFAEALRIDPGFFPAAIDLADLHSRHGEEGEAEKVLRAALPHSGGSGAVHHALGLSLVRQRRLSQALPMLEQAARREPRNARFIFVYAVALHDAGRPSAALAALRAAATLAPEDSQIRGALAAWQREAAGH